MSDISPTKRRCILARKNVNIRSPHRRRKGGSANCSPSKVGITVSNLNTVERLSEQPPRMREDAITGFSFYQETPEERVATMMNQISLVKQRVQDENDYECVKENLAHKNSASKVKKPRLSLKKRALNDLSIEDYAGFIQFRKSPVAGQLTLHIKHPTKIPNFVTPPRSAKLKDFFSTNSNRDVRPDSTISRTTEDICMQKVVRKLAFKVHSNTF